MSAQDEFEGLQVKYSRGRYVWPNNEWERPSLGKLAKWKFFTKDYSNVPDKEVCMVLS